MNSHIFLQTLPIVNLLADTSVGLRNTPFPRVAKTAGPLSATSEGIPPLPFAIDRTKGVLVSVIIPAKNEAARIGRCIESLLRQSVGRERMEIIVMDNGSTDATVETARRLGARVEIAPKDSIAALRNRGAALAQGRVLAFVDADMEMPSDFVEYFLDLTAKSDCRTLGLGTVAGGINRVFSIWEERNLRRGTLRQVDFLSSQNIIMTREAFEQVGGFDETLKTGEDKDLIQRLTAAGVDCRLSGERVAVHWGADASLGQFLRKEYWRQREALRLALKNGATLRLLRFPLVSVALLLALTAAVLALPVHPWALPVVLGLSLAFSAALAVGKWHRRHPQDIAVVAVLALLRFWTAGAATLSALPGLLGRERAQTAEDNEQARLKALAAQYGLLPTFQEKAADIFVRVTLGLILGPIFLVLIGMVYVFIKLILREPGPFFYVDKRLGLYKKVFSFYKIRSLKENAAQVLGASYYTGRDKKMTIRGGDFLRSTRLDELPQLFNYLKGDMAIIGPRPIRPIRQRELATPDVHFLTKPGLTGVSQLITPHQTSERLRAILDNNIYGNHCSMWMQFKWAGITCYALVRKVHRQLVRKLFGFIKRKLQGGVGKERRRADRVPANNTILVEHEGQIYSYCLRDINRTAFAFLVEHGNDLDVGFTDVKKVTIVVQTPRTEKAARCKVRLLRVSEDFSTGMDLVVMEYKPSSMYSNYLIDKYILQECIYK